MRLVPLGQTSGLCILARCRGAIPALVAQSFARTDDDLGWGCPGLAIASGATLAQDYPWKPDRPITLIVPGAAGGSTDQMARIVATEIEAEIKQKVVVVNQPGASGSVGSKNVMEAAKDGYTWAAGAAVDIGTYKVLGLLDSGLKDWHLFFAIANLTAVSANPNAPFKDFGQFLDTLKAKALA